MLNHLDHTRPQVLVGAVLWEVERQRAVSGVDYGLTESAQQAETLYLAELKRGAAEDMAQSPTVA